MSQFSTLLILACALGVAAALNYSPDDYPKKTADKANATKPQHTHNSKPHHKSNHHGTPHHFQHAKPCDKQQEQHHHFNHAPPHMHHGPPAIHYHYHYASPSCGCQKQQETCKPEEPKTTQAPIVEPVTTPEPTTTTTTEQVTTTVADRLAQYTPVAPIELMQKSASFFKESQHAEYNNNHKFDRDH